MSGEETFQELKKRLLAEGGEARWNEADDDIKNNVAGGMKRSFAVGVASYKFQPEGLGPALLPASSPSTPYIPNPIEFPRKQKKSKEDGRFVDPKVFRGKKSTGTEDIHWVAEHISCNIDQLNPAQAPSGAAWGMLFNLGSGGWTYKDFYAVLAKLLPTGSQLDQERRMKDAGKNLDTTLSEILDFGDDTVLRPDSVPLPESYDKRSLQK